MALTYSSMLSLKSELAAFNLLNTVTGERFTSDDLDKRKIEKQKKIQKK